ncbi:uncharacterized protein LOC124388722 [Silurus meridionalis]|uniref:uncharacterized protein LOC124388722 n=1 Tax=Silurus meridionalis TaxID=175797 RepID=UPI001EEA6759|nr:uncharacterized protein LOC124388722 [Silurus meridionalis]
MVQEDLEESLVQKNPLIENKAEGSGEDESRPATHTSQPCTSSPAEADHKNPTTEKQQDGSPPEKRTNDGLESEERNENDAPLTQEKENGENNADVWKFTTDNNNIIDFVRFMNLTNILSFLETNYLKKELLQNDKRIFFGNVDNTFLEMLNKKTEKYINKNKNRQHAFVFLKKKVEGEYIIDIKGPYKPKNKKYKHSEDFIMEEIKPLINKDLSEIWIYTLNNPCIGRKNHLPCMYNLIKFSERYPDLKMNIVFSKYYIFINNINRIRDKEEIKANAGLSEEQESKYNKDLVLTFLKNFQGRRNLKFFHMNLDNRAISPILPICLHNLLLFCRFFSNLYFSYFIFLCFLNFTTQ